MLLEESLGSWTVAVSMEEVAEKKVVISKPLGVLLNELAVIAPWSQYLKA